MHLSINILGILTVALCAVLLLRAYIKGRTRLLLWSGLCFLGLTLSNILLVIDLAVVPHVSLYTWRQITAAAGVLLLVYGLIFESD